MQRDSTVALRAHASTSLHATAPHRREVARASRKPSRIARAPRRRAAKPSLIARGWATEVIPGSSAECLQERRPRACASMALDAGVRISSRNQAILDPALPQPKSGFAPIPRGPCRATLQNQGSRLQISFSQHRAHFAEQRIRRNRLLNEFYIGIEHAVVDNGIFRIAGHEDDLHCRSNLA